MRPAIHGMSTEISLQHHQFEVNSIGVQGNVNFAPFQSRKPEAGSSIFILQFSPGLDYLRMQYHRPLLDGGEFTGAYQSYKSYRLSPNIGLNLLWEFELTELLSIAPQIGVRYYPALRWNNFTELVSEGEMTNSFDETDWRHLTFGLRIGLNLGRREKNQ